MKRRSRIQRLEEKLEALRAQYVGIPEVSAWLSDLLTIVQEEAGQATAARVAGKIVGRKVRQVQALSEAQHENHR